MEVVSVWDPKYKPQGPQRQERMPQRQGGNRRQPRPQPAGGEIQLKEAEELGKQTSACKLECWSPRPGECP